ncbi:MAG: DNA polymerase III subunit gamma/tau [Clostridia bacterium]|nr:DNA polymerase III subunit gamma/tau [Clostridia bacterium]
MHQALYRKWRPQTFDDVYGQEHITSILKYETENSKFSHAYLFCGSRGTGKTTCAKILAKAVNCTSPVNGSPCNKCASCLSIDAGTATDVLEMDAASNNGVDNIRDIRDEVVYTPSSLKYRVYIVDEVHMLSGSAFNALLKTLEEPPAHAVFVLATTELHKLPSTIVSRCQRHDFRRISTDTLVSRLAYISDKENIEYDREALRIIAKMAQGGMRDAISLLELCAGNREKITAELVNATLGVGGRDSAERVVRAIAASDFDTVFGAIENVVRSSKDILVFWQDLIAFYRDMLVVKTTKAAKNYLDLTDDELEKLNGAASLFTKDTLLYHCRVLDDTFYVMQKSGFAKRTVAEMALVKMCDMSIETSTDAILARLSKLESKVAAGSFAPPAAVPKEIETAPSKSEEIKDELPPKPVAAPTQSEASLKVLRGWSEICDVASADNGMALGFLKMAKALTDGSKIYVRFENNFAVSMVDKPDIREALRVALCNATQRSISGADIIFGVFEGDEDNISDLNEFNLD